MPCATAAFRRWCGAARGPGGPTTGSRAAGPERRPGLVRADRLVAAAFAGPPPGRVASPPITKGTPGLAIPAFSIGDRLQGVAQVLHVVALDLGHRADQRRRTLVLSSRPPSPTSATAISTPRAAKSAKAIAVVASKKVACRPDQGLQPLGPHGHRRLARSARRPPDAFPERHQVGRGVEPDPEPAPRAAPRPPGCRRFPCRWCRRCAPRGKTWWGWPSSREQRPGGVQPELDRGGAREEELERRAVARGVIRPAGSPAVRAAGVGLMAEHQADNVPATGDPNHGPIHVASRSVCSQTSANSRIPGVHRGLHALPRVRALRAERGLPLAQRSAREQWTLGLRMYGTGRRTRLNRQGCRCPFYQGPGRGCAAYEDRPLICNLFPLDIIEREEDGQLLVGAVRRLRGSGARQARRGEIDEARELATEIDRRMPDDLPQAFMADAGARSSSRCSTTIRFTISSPSPHPA